MAEPPVDVAIEAFGDSAVRVRIAGPIGLNTSARVHAVAGAIGRATSGRSGWGRPVPAASSLLVPVDPIDPGVEAAAEAIRELLDGLAASREPAASLDWLEPGPTIEIPVRYGGEAGPDLDVVAELTGLTPAAVVERHASTTYRALFLGFAPGFAYLGVVPPAIVVARRAEPRVRVPAGSVGLAGEQTAVYPMESPGGWQLIGRTGTSLWDPRRTPPARIQPGDAVRFVPER